MDHMHQNNTYNEILLNSEEYLLEIVQEYKRMYPNKHALKQIQDSLFHSAGDPDSNQLTQKRYDFLSGLLEVIVDVDKKETLKQFLDEIYQLAKVSYNSERHFENLRSYVKIGELFDEDLISSLASKLEHHVRKEVKFLQMKEPKYLDNEICDLAIGSIQNLTFQLEEPTQQQTYEIVLLYEIFNFRLSTLNAEQAWDFMAQSILEEAKTTKPS